MVHGSWFMVNESLVVVSLLKISQKSNKKSLISILNDFRIDFLKILSVATLIPEA